MKTRFSLILVVAVTFAVGLGLLLSCAAPSPAPLPEATAPAAADTATPAGPQTPTPVPPTATPPPGPPQVLSIKPARGEELPPEQPIEIVFDRSLDANTVQLAFEPALAGQIDVAGGRVRFQPAAFVFGQRYTLELQAAAGGFETGPLRFGILTQGHLQVANTTPADGNDSVVTDAAISIVFNRPIVPLGAAGDDPSLPQPLTLNPAAAGKGAWLNTSIYLFQPDPPLLAGTEYVATVEGVSDLSGSGLAAPYTFGFTTDLPVVRQVLPAGDKVAPTTAITLTFSQPMDPASTAAALSVQAHAGDHISGSTRWLDENRTLVFTPGASLPLGQNILVAVTEAARAQGSQAGLRRSHSHNFVVAPFPAVQRTQPRDGAQNTSIEDAVQIIFNAPILPETLKLSISPPISATQVYSWYSDYDSSFTIFFPRQALTEYAISLAAGISDPYGNAIAEPVAIRFRTGERRPALSMLAPGAVGVYDASAEAAIYFSHVNVDDINLTLARLTPEQFAALSPQEDYERWRSYTPPPGQIVRRWTLQPQATRNQTTLTREPLLDAAGAAIAPGLYYLGAESPQVRYETYDLRPRVLLVVTPYNVVVKRGRDDALVWVTNLAGGQPVAGAPVTVYPYGEQPVSGRTGADGIFRTGLPVSNEPWRGTQAFLGTAAAPGWGNTNWNEGLSAWTFDLPAEFYLQPYRIHLYTERPLYRAGDTVHFRAVLRSDDDANYSVPPDLVVSATLRNPRGDVVQTMDLTTDSYGAVYGDLALSQEAQLGMYNLELRAAENNSAWANFLVAAFRKPEYELQASVSPQEVLATQPAQATMQASYFFGGPVKDAQVRWTLYSAPYVFTYDDGQNWSFNDFRPDAFFQPVQRRFREAIGSGAGRTDDQGQFVLDVPTDLLGEAPESDLRTIEFSVTDIGDQEVSGAANLVIHAAAVYPGVRPDRYVGTAGQEQLAHFIAVDALQRQPAAGQELAVSVTQIAWRTVREQDEQGRTRFTSRVDESEVASGAVTTGDDGLAAFTWTPTEPGQYLIRAAVRDGLGNQARSAAFTWIAGEDYAPWRVTNDDRIDLVADRDEYQVGDVARVLVPSPFQGEAQALVTIERAGIISHQVLTLASNSETLEFPILPAYAPNVFVSVVLVQPPVGEEAPTFKFGLAQLNVDPGQHLIDLAINATPDPAWPGDAVRYELRAADFQGNPVQAQLSLALVDRALLALQPESGPTINQTFWNRRGLGVQTGVSLVVSLNRVDEAQSRGTKGGGGGGFDDLAQFDVRSDFRDLAYWQADVETGADGQASVEVTLPDNLTTWQMRAVAATRDTAVGEATHHLLVTKPLLVRPVLPRFVVHGDRFQVGAIVQNNTGRDQVVDLSFDLLGLSPQANTTYRLNVADGGLARVDLPVLVQDIDPTSRLVLDEVRVRMTAVGGSFTDALEIGLPVRRYSSPETTATAGVVRPDEVRYEAIALPERYDPTQGDLTVRLEPSLAAGMVGGLNYLEHYPYECTEQTISRFLPNVLTARALANLGVANAELSAHLEQKVNLALQQLYTRQQADGGWGWFAQERSHPYTSAYALFGLTAAQRGGYAVDAEVMSRAARFLQRQLRAPSGLAGYRLNQQAFIVYVLDDYGRLGTEAERPLAEAQLLYEERERMALYAQAYLALTLQAQSEVADTAAQAQSLLDALLGAAILSATGAHWEEEAIDWWSMNTDTRTTAAALAAIVAIRPDHALGANVVRWLMSARSADRWESTHETAWALIALTDWMAATGELGANYAWSATLNGQVLGQGDVSAATVDQPQTLRVAVGDLLADQLNYLALERDDGPGQLYYSAYLRVYLPVPDLQPVNRGVTVARRYTLAAVAGQETGAGGEITAAQVGDVIDVELTLVAPTTLHYLLVEDPIPAGAEPIDASLATTSERFAGPEIERQEEQAPAWGWYWIPASFELKDDKVALFATELLPGTYTFRYQLRATVAGQFNVLPPRAEMMYFPEVFGHGAGSAFSITRP